MVRVAGADGCRGGWLVCSLLIDGESIMKWDWKLCPLFRDVLVFSSGSGTLAVDMPIGLLTTPEPGGRQCDREARRLLGARRSTIFTPPIRSWLNVTDYHEVREKGVSRQAFGIFKKIREVDQCMTPAMQCQIVEAHPELSFTSLNGQVPRHNKKIPEGLDERISGFTELGSTCFTRIRSTIEEIRTKFSKTLVCQDDILDAAVLAWTAGRIYHRQASCVPETPLMDEKGLRMEIWY